MAEQQGKKLKAKIAHEKLFLPLIISKVFRTWCIGFVEKEKTNCFCATKKKLVEENSLKKFVVRFVCKIRKSL